MLRSGAAGEEPNWTPPPPPHLGQRGPLCWLSPGQPIPAESGDFGQSRPLPWPPSPPPLPRGCPPHAPGTRRSEEPLTFWQGLSPSAPSDTAPSPRPQQLGAKCGRVGARRGDCWGPGGGPGGSLRGGWALQALSGVCGVRLYLSACKAKSLLPPLKIRGTLAEGMRSPVRIWLVGLVGGGTSEAPPILSLPVNFLQPALEAGEIRHCSVLPHGTEFVREKKNKSFL